MGTLGITAALLLAGLSRVIASSTPTFFERGLFIGLFDLGSTGNISAALLTLSVTAWVRWQTRSAEAV